MQNPFIRLKKYEKDVCDPQENRTTETLAACLVFSVEMRREFLNFLFPERPDFTIADAEAYEVSTQQQTTDGSWVDLFIERENEESVVVEVKVKAKEYGPQIKKYVGWLNDEKKNNRRFVFHLVKGYHDLAFDITKYGGDKHYTWKKLYDHFSKIKKTELESTDANLIEHFCNYLEVEGIVSTWEPKTILDYRTGVAARRALRNLFEQVENRLLDSKMDFETKMVMRDESWPCLEIGRKSWKSIFGEGYLNKISVNYVTSTGGQDHLDTFYFQINLWDRQHRSVWNFTEAKLPQWIKILEDLEFGIWGSSKGNKPLMSEITEHKFNEAPKVISACWDSSQYEISKKEIESMTSDELVGEIYSRVLKHCDIISQFK